MLDKYHSWSHLKPTLISLEEIMHKKIKKAESKIEKKIDKSEKTVKGEFKGLLKEDKKLDQRVETAESKLRKMKKGC